MQQQTVAAKPREWFVILTGVERYVTATVPVEMVPAWARRKRIQRAAAFMDGSGEGRWGIFRDMGPWPCPIIPESDADQTALLAAVEQRQLAQRSAKARVVVDYTCAPPDCAWLDALMTRLDGWHFTGCESEGLLLEGDLWLRSFRLSLGREYVNQIRAILGLPALTSMQVTWSEKDRRQYVDRPSFHRCARYRHVLQPQRAEVRHQFFR